MIEKKIFLILLVSIFSGLLFAQVEEDNGYPIVTVKKLGFKQSDFEDSYYDGSLGTPIEASYAVLSVIKGQLSEDTINCITFSYIYHSTELKTEFALLYLSKLKGQFYLFEQTDLYMTVTGDLAGIFPQRDYEHPNNLNSQFFPVKLEFIESVAFDLKIYNKRRIPLTFPSPYYRITKSKAIPIYGNYPNELFLLRENGRMRDRKEWEKEQMKKEKQVTSDKQK